jgi:hypothetical protein
MSSQIPMSEVERTRRLAENLLTAHPEALALRSCWNCNPAHEYMKRNDDYVISCPWCGNFYFQGVDITDYEGER